MVENRVWAELFLTAALSSAHSSDRPLGGREKKREKERKNVRKEHTTIRTTLCTFCC